MFHWFLHFGQIGASFGVLFMSVQVSQNDISACRYTKAVTLFCTYGCFLNAETIDCALRCFFSGRAGILADRYTTAQPVNAQDSPHNTNTKKSSSGTSSYRFPRCVRETYSLSNALDVIMHTSANIAPYWGGRRLA